MDTGELISLYRKQSKMTVDELAQKSGVPKGTLNKIIGGVTKAPTLPNMKAIARGHVKSCGCLIHRKYIKQNGGRLYRIYSGMKTRCYNKNSEAYKNYGNRGISVCSEWLNDFWAFYNWATSHGYKDNLTIDRIDNDKGYSPENCRWATIAEQNRNKRAKVAKSGGAA